MFYKRRVTLYQKAAIAILTQMVTALGEAEHIVVSALL
jgi:hypothetical protein